MGENVEDDKDFIDMTEVIDCLVKVEPLATCKVFGLEIPEEPKE